MAAAEEGIDGHILEAILEGARAGVFRRAARLSPQTTRDVWSSLAESHSRGTTTLLAKAMKRLGVGSAGPSSHAA